jgi:hypothetical protein
VLFKKLISLTKKFIKSSQQLDENEITPIGLLPTELAPSPTSKPRIITNEEKSFGSELSEKFATLYYYIMLESSILQHNGFKIKNESGEKIKSNYFAIYFFNKFRDKVLELKQMPTYDSLISARLFLLYMDQQEKELSISEKIINKFLENELGRPPSQSFEYARTMLKEIQEKLSILS